MRCKSKQVFNPDDVENVFIVRLLTSLREYAQHQVEDYWKHWSTCPFDMPIGLDNFKIINDHIDGSTKTSNLRNVVCDIEKYVIAIHLFSQLQETDQYSIG